MEVERAVKLAFDLQSPNVTQVAAACTSNVSGLLLSVTTCSVQTQSTTTSRASEFRNKWRNGPQFVGDWQLKRAATRDVQYLCMLPVRTAKQSKRGGQGIRNRVIETRQEFGRSENACSVHHPRSAKLGCMAMAWSSVRADVWQWPDEIGRAWFLTRSIWWRLVRLENKRSNLLRMSQLN